jgi:UDP-GlcNAc:undecaprenyl-phosphate/decaprenyl-phosphate GlcNAc-1-phosphate transferase
MNLSLIAIVVSFVGAFISTIIVKFFCLKYKIVDNPDGYRKVHTKPVPLCGGFAVFLGFIFPVLLLYLFYTSHSLFGEFDKKETQVFTFFLGACITMFMGAADDIWHLRPKYKLLFQFIAATFAYFGGLKVTSVTIPFLGGSVELLWMSYPVTIFWFLGCINAINLLDGLDGLASGIGLFAALTLFVVSILFNHQLPMFLSACLVGAILGFLIFNFNPASIFLGDTGSMLIGYLIAGLGVLSSYKSETAVALMIPFIALGVPIFDTLLAILRRWSKRLPVSAADKKHIHHILLSMGLSHRKVVLILYGCCLLFSSIAILMAFSQNIIGVIFLLVVGIITFVGVRVFGMLDFTLLKHRIKYDRRERKQNSKSAIAVEKSIQLMVDAESPEDVWACTFESLEVIDLDHAAIILTKEDKEHVFKWKNTRPHEEGFDKWSLFLNLHDGERIIGELEVWRKGKEVPIRDSCMLINKLRHALTEHLIRVLDKNDSVDVIDFPA